MPIGTAHAIWSGVGTAAIAVIGLLAFGETLTAAKPAGPALIVAGVVVLNMGGAAHEGRGEPCENATCPRPSNAPRHPSWGTGPAPHPAGWPAPARSG